MKINDMAIMDASKKSTFATTPVTDTDHASVDNMLQRSDRTNYGTLGEEKSLSLSRQRENSDVKNEERRQGSVYAKRCLQ